MEGPEKCSPSTSPEKSDTLKNKFKSRAKKRKRESSGSTEDEVLPENTFEVDKNLHALAIKNNLDDISVKKILKKVVTNDHVLALVKLREEEELAETEDVQPKLTRAKAKELMKASPNSAPWNLELTPIKHIPVKTRPEVKALIAQELPDDEDDEEYQPTHDDVPSDDDHATCSDIDSQPATPATPKSQSKSSPKVVTDGPFKVPQETVSQARRQLELEEEATIALRTRSKLSLSETPIEHIESSFVPPDDIPHQDVDDLWNDFLKDCLNPVSNTRHEDDDETDPEYNVAADPDAVEEDEESLENSLIKISKKELNDLVTELFNVLPEPQPSPVLTNATIEGCKNEPSNKQWEGKQEPLSDEEHRSSKACLVFERDDTLKISIGKTEPYDVQEDHCMEQAVKHTITEPVIVTMVEEHVQVEETRDPPEPPPALRSVLNVAPEPLTVEIENNAITEQQILILQQQLRMHIQLAASNFLQLFVNPVHWTYAPKYKEYIESLNSMLDKDKNSVVNVCNLKLALELITSWESSVSEDTPENKKMVEFIQGEVDKCRRRTQIHGVYVGDFPKLFKEVIACSSVFLYPYLLPPMPYRAEEVRRRPNYLPSEDQLIILGLDQFWSYVEANPEIYQRPKLCRPHHRWWLSLTIELLCKYMFPWVSTKTMAGHISAVRKTRHKQHPINKFMTSRYVEPTKHVLMPFNPELTLYEQPEGEMPRLWVRYLAKSSKRFRSYLLKKRPPSFKAPQGVEVVPGVDVSTAPKNPLPIEFAKKFTCNRINCHPVEPVVPDRVDVDIIDPLSSASLFEVVETDNGMILKPIKGPADTEVQDIPPVETVSTSQIMINPDGHCSCCSILRKICKYKQKRITEYMAKFKVKMACPCKSIKHPKITNKLKILLTYYKCRSTNIFTELQKKIFAKDTHKVNLGLSKELEDQENDARDQAFVSKFLIRLAMREGKARNQQIKRSLFTTLSRFHPDEGDPLQLMENIYNACEVDLADMYKEFVGFLNPEQAEKIDKFRDYFIHNCMEDLIKKIEESVTDRKRKTSILQYLTSLARKNPSSCVLCTELLNRMHDYPQLARYCFSLFPHRRKVNIQTSSIKTVDLTKTPKKKALISQTTNRNNPTSYVKIQPKPSESMECVNDVISNQNVIKVITCNVGNESQDTAHSDNVKSNQDCIHSQKHTVVSKQDSVQSQEGSVVSNQDNVQLQKDSVISKQDNVQSQADNVISNPNNVESEEDSVASKQDSVQSQADSVVSNQDNVQSQENSVVSSQDNVQSQEDSVISNQDNVQSQEDSVISNQDNVQSQENSVVSDQDNVQTQKGSVISKQDNLQSQEDSVVSNQANVALADNVVSDQDNVQSQGDSVVSNQDNVQSLADNVVSNQDNVQSQGDSVISNPDNVQSQRDDDTSNQDNVQSLRVDVISNQDNVQSQGGSVISYHDAIELQELDDDIDDDTEHEGMLRICEDTNTDNVIYIISSDDDSEDTTQIKNMNRQLESTNKMPIPKVEIEEDTKISKILIEADCSPESEPEDMDISDSVPPSDCDDEEIEWKREEDKLILEVLQQHLTPEERNDKTIIERIEEKDIPQIIANSLKYKTLRGIRDRIYYLLQILVLSELNDD